MAEPKVAMVSFEPTGANLGVADKYQDQLVLSYRVQLARIYPHRASRESITLSTEEKFEDLDSRISVLAETNELKNVDDRLHDRHLLEDGEKGIGFIQYVPAFSDDLGLYCRASCGVRVFVPKVTFDELLASARLGRLPSHISVEVEGMQYDWQPDGSGKKWDNKAFPELAVTSISFGTVPLVAQAMSSDFDQDLYNQILPPTRSQFNELAEKLGSLAIAIKTGLRSLLWAVLVIGTLILFFLR